MTLNETEIFLYTRYDSLTLSTKQLAEVLHYKTTRVLLNSISAGSCPVHTYKLGKSRVAHIQDVAQYLYQARGHVNV